MEDQAYLPKNAHRGIDREVTEVSADAIDERERERGEEKGGLTDLFLSAAKRAARVSSSEAGGAGGGVEGFGAGFSVS